MGMSNYILDCEENFWDSVVDIIKESETIVEATTKAMELWKKEVPHLDEDDVFGQVEDYWNDFWSNYIQRGYNMIDYEAYRFFENEDGMKELAKEMINKNIDLAKSLQFELNAQLQDKEVAEGSIDWDIKVPEASDFITEKEYKFDW